MPGYVWFILAIAGVLLSYFGGKKIEFRAFCKELGEGFLAIDEFLGVYEDPGATAEMKVEAAENLRKEWLDVVEAGGALFAKIMNKVHNPKRL